MISLDHAVPHLDDPKIGRRASINPYLTCAYDVFWRLAWDVKPESWRSRARLKHLKDSHRGEKAVIMCNGPSLNRVDFESLSGVYCFGLNKINLMFEKTAFRPSCIVAIDMLVIEQNAAFYNATEIPLILPQDAVDFVKSGPDRIFVHLTGARRRFSGDSSMSINGGHTVTNVALHLAFHLGFDSVAIVGCDHHYNAKGPPGKVFQTDPSDTDHFDPRYWSSVPMKYANLFEMEVSYQQAFNYYRAHGRKLVNATDGGKLEILPRMALEEFLHGR